MSQHDMNIANGPGASFRADLNGALAALASLSSGASAPSPTFPFQFWADTGTGRLKQRNSANTAWFDMGAIDSALRDSVGACSFAVGAGAANAITATYSPAVTAFTDGMVLMFKAGATNTGAVTFAPSGLAAKAIVSLGHMALTGGEIALNGDVWLQYNASVGGGSWVMIASSGGSAAGAAPTGSSLWHYGMAPPSGYLVATGAAYSRTTYAALFSALTAQPVGTVTSGSPTLSAFSAGVPQAMWVGMPISGPGIPAGATITAVASTTITISANATATTVGATVAVCPFGVGDGSTTFNIPDARGKSFRGWDNGAGIDPGRIFASYQLDQLPSHTHGYGSAATVQSGSGISVIQGGLSPAANTAAAGTGTEVRVKNLALLPCIKY